MNSKRIFVLSFLVLLSVLFCGLFAGAKTTTDKPFVVVIDAGHGGHDPGAMGAKGQEKDINLAISLELGKKIEAMCPDVKVYYTRKTDVFVTLQGRADFVNKHKADLFICVHTNSAKSANAHGVETFTLGLNKSQSNLDVAMRENSVMLLEDDYKTKYQGFNPSSVESYIMFEFMQDQYVDRSVQFASMVQKEFVGNAKRNDRGVRQAAFWVLHKSACPSVLIEVGFITNAEEEKFLLSNNGRETMANCIFNAFVAYKRNVDRKSGKQFDEQENKQEDKSADKKNNENEKENSVVEAHKEKQIDNQHGDNGTVNISTTTDVGKKTGNDTTQINKNETIAADVVYKVQFLSTTKVYRRGATELKGLEPTYYHENGLNKYTTGATDDYDAIVRLNHQVKGKFPDCFIIAFIKGEKVAVTKAREYQTKTK